MEPSPIQIGLIYTYNRTGEKFEITGHCQVKDAGDANWSEGVIFKVLDNPEDLPYVRTTADFLNKYSLLGASDADNFSDDLHSGTTHWVEPGKN